MRAVDLAVFVLLVSWAQRCAAGPSLRGQADLLRPGEDVKSNLSLIDERMAKPLNVSVIQEEASKTAPGWGRLSPEVRFKRNSKVKSSGSSGWGSRRRTRRRKWGIMSGARASQARRFRQKTRRWRQKARRIRLRRRQARLGRRLLRRRRRRALLRRRRLRRRRRRLRRSRRRARWLRLLRRLRGLGNFGSARRRRGSKTESQQKKVSVFREEARKIPEAKLKRKSKVKSSGSSGWGMRRRRGWWAGARQSRSIRKQMRRIRAKARRIRLSRHRARLRRRRLRARARRARLWRRRMRRRRRRLRRSRSRARWRRLLRRFRKSASARRRYGGSRR